MQDWESQFFQYDWVIVKELWKIESLEGSAHSICSKQFMQLKYERQRKANQKDVLE